MAYAQVQIKADEVMNPKFIYLCQTRGCGNQISEFPAAEKIPAPQKCKLCMNKETKHAIRSRIRQASFLKKRKKKTKMDKVLLHRCYKVQREQNSRRLP